MGIRLLIFTASRGNNPDAIFPVYFIPHRFTKLGISTCRKNSKQSHFFKNRAIHEDWTRDLKFPQCWSFPVCDYMDGLK